MRDQQSIGPVCPCYFFRPLRAAPAVAGAPIPRLVHSAQNHRSGSGCFKFTHGRWNYAQTQSVFVSHKSNNARNTAIGAITYPLVRTVRIVTCNHLAIAEFLAETIQFLVIPVIPFLALALLAFAFFSRLSFFTKVEVQVIDFRRNAALLTSTATSWNVQRRCGGG